MLSSVRPTAEPITIGQGDDERLIMRTSDAAVPAVTALMQAAHGPDRAAENMPPYIGLRYNIQTCIRTGTDKYSHRCTRSCKLLTVPIDLLKTCLSTSA